MKRASGRLTTVATLGLFVVSSCGGSGPAERTDDRSTLTASERSQVSEAQIALITVCFRVSEGEPLTEDDRQNVERGTELFKGLAGAKPEATYADESGRKSMRQLLSNQASDLDLCLPRVADELNRAASSLPFPTD